jgi:hypothetical protein
MSDQSSLCTRCKADNLRDGYFCLPCQVEMARIEEAEADLKKRIIHEDEYMPRTNAERVATVGRLVNLAPDDDGEAVVSMTGFQIYATRERIEGSSPATW